MTLRWSNIHFRKYHVGIYAIWNWDSLIQEVYSSKERQEAMEKMRGNNMKFFIRPAICSTFQVRDSAQTLERIKSDVNCDA